LFAYGTGTIRPLNNRLVLEAEAADADSLAHVEDVLARHLERFRQQVRPDARSRLRKDLSIPDDAPLNPGTWCQFCPVRLECPALHARSTDLAKRAFAQSADALPLMDNETIGRILTQADMVLPWIEELRNLALDRMKFGGDVPGWKMVAKRGHRVWLQEDQETVLALSHMGLLLEDIWQPVKPRTAAQIEKKIKPADMGEFRKLWRMESSGVTVAPEGDPRRAVPPEAALAFDPVKS